MVARLLFILLQRKVWIFSELVKDLASVYRTRIELRQIGVRDEAKRISGCGICGRKQCCSAFLQNLNRLPLRWQKISSLH